MLGVTTLVTLLFGIWCSYLCMQANGGAIIVGDGVTATFDLCTFLGNGAPPCNEVAPTLVRLAGFRMQLVCSDAGDRALVQLRHKIMLCKSLYASAMTTWQ